MALMGVDSLRNNLTNPARTYMWEIIMPTPIGGGQTELFQIRARSTQIPGRSNGAIEIPYKQTAGIVVSGKLKYSHKWSCDLIEGEDKKTWNALRAWQQTIVHDVAGVGIGDQLYKTDAYLTMITTKDGDIWMKLKMKGLWLEEVGEVALNFDGEGDFVKYPVSFAFDSFEDLT